MRCCLAADDTAAKASDLDQCPRWWESPRRICDAGIDIRASELPGPEKEVVHVDSKMTCIECHGKPHEDA